MALLKRFINFFPFPLFAFHFYLDINAYSNSLYFDTFSEKWKNIPSTKPVNRAVDFSRSGVEYKEYGLRFGSEGITKINRGFIETWYYASSDFNTLLKREDIGYYITNPDISGNLNYAEYYAFYIKKRASNTDFTLSFLKGKRLEYIKLKGINTKNRFIADLDYVYTGENIITHQYKADGFRGYGLSFDMEKRVKYKNLSAFLGVYNIFGFIEWSGVSYMHYHFDSQTKYTGEDGYIHYKPFGVGHYYSGYNFFQKLPFFVKYKLSYNQKRFSLGNEGIFSSNNRFNTPFVKVKFKKIWFKGGYVIESQNYVFGTGGKNFTFEISKSVKFHSKFAKLLLDIKF